MTAQWKTGEFDTFLSVNSILLCKYFEYIHNYILCRYMESNHKLYFFPPCMPLPSALLLGECTA